MRKSSTPVPPRIPAARAAAPAFMGHQGGNQNHWESEKRGKNPRVSRVSGRAGPEECYFWMWTEISWLVWVSVGGGAGLIKADDLGWASSCGIGDHDKQQLKQSREPSQGTHGCCCQRSPRTRLWVTTAEFLAHQGVFPISLCMDGLKGLPHTVESVVSSATVVTPLTVSPQVALLEFEPPSSSEQNSGVAFTESNPREPRKTLKHWEILNIPVLLEVLQSPPLHQVGAGEGASSQMHTQALQGCPAVVNDVLPPATEKGIMWFHTPPSHPARCGRSVSWEQGHSCIEFHCHLLPNAFGFCWSICCRSLPGMGCQTRKIIISVGQ